MVQGMRVALGVEVGSAELADSLMLFLRDLRGHKLLTAAEEVVLAKRVERGDSAAKQRMIGLSRRSERRPIHGSSWW